MVGMAQLVRASGCGPEGRGFESHYSPQKKALAKASAFLTKSADGGRNPPAVDEIALR